MYNFDRDRSVLRSLFVEHHSLPAIQQAVLEGPLGQAWGDDPQAPTAARLDLGCYGVFAGDPAAPGAEELIEWIDAANELVYPDEAWRRRIIEFYGGKVHDRPMESFSGEWLDPEHLRSFSEEPLEGFVIKRLESTTVLKLDDHLKPNGLQTYPTPEALISKGMAWGALTCEPTPRLVSVASSYARSSCYVEVAISTHAEHRGRGLATAVAARFCLAALDLDLEPCWNASNPISKRLAQRLGFQSRGECEILLLADSTASTAG